MLKTLFCVLDASSEEQLRKLSREISGGTVHELRWSPRPDGSFDVALDVRPDAPRSPKRDFPATLRRIGLG